MFRSSTVFLLSLSMFGQVAQYWVLTRFFPPTIPGTVANIKILQILYIVIGTIAFVYWMVNRPDYRPNQRPLGILLLAGQNALVGVILVIEGVLFLFLPILGIIGLAIGGLGIGLCLLSKGLFEGQDWALAVMKIITIIGVVAGIVVGLSISQLALGIPLLSLFQLWYLFRRYVSNFFYGVPAGLSSISPATREAVRYDARGREEAF